MSPAKRNSMATLVCGLVDEAPVAMLVDALQKIGASFLVVNQETMANDVQLRWQLTDRGISGHLKIADQVLDVGDICSVYHRFVSPEDVPGSGSSMQSVSKSRSILRALMDLLDILPCRIVNRRRPMMSNNSKPYQALLIRQAGFSIPETLITNDARSLARFASAKSPLVYKSISSVRSIVAPLDGGSMVKIESLRNLPTQFQRRIEGFNVRVHVVGERLFATQIVSAATDYRYAAWDGVPAELRPFDLNTDLQKRCLHLAKLCQLAFAGIDLIISPGRVYCLEVNPAPAYSYYQDVTGQPISDALAEYLVCNQFGRDF